MREKSGDLWDLKEQPEYELIPSIRKDGKVIERSCSYRADFEYQDADGRHVVDVKGFKTPIYRLKKKLMAWRYGIFIEEL